jgi:hypothetical protein
MGDKSIASIAIDLIEEIRPDIFESIHRRLIHKELDGLSRTEYIPLSRIKRGGIIRHETLPTDLVGRIRLIRAALIGFYTHSMEFWLAGFQRDAHPSREVGYWERIASVITEYRSVAKLTSEQRKQVFGLVLDISNGRPEEELTAEAAGLPDGTVELLQILWTMPVRFSDLEENISIFDADPDDPSPETDLEHFPDLPDEVLDRLSDEAVDELLFRRRTRGDI